MAVLWVTKSGEHGLDFTLQTSAAVALRTPVRFSPADRAQMEQQLRYFAERVQGLAADADLRDLGLVLYRLLVPAPIRDELDRLQEPITLYTEDASVPWELLFDGQEFLSLRHTFSRRLILQDRIRGWLGMPEAPERFSALVISDPTMDLPGANMEGRAVVNLFESRFPNSTVVLEGSQATWLAINKALVERPYSVIHYCGHIGHDMDGESTMRLVNAAVSASSVMRLFRGEPVVFLNSCHAARNANRAAPLPGGAESFAQAFMLGNEKGVAPAVVGTIWEIPDEPAEVGVEVACAFYDRLLKGMTVSTALRAARRVARDERHWSPLFWGSYVLYGDHALPAASLAGPPAHSETTRAALPPQPPGAPEAPAASVTVSPPVAPPLEASATTTDGVTLADSAREVLRVAMRESAKMRQGGIGTMHLLIGLCDQETKVETLRDLAAVHSVDLAGVAESALRKARELMPAGGSGFGLSENALMVLGIAMARARLWNRTGADAEDILAGLLDWGEGTALGILAAHGIRAEDLESRLPRVRVGELERAQCTPEAWRLLWAAAMRAAPGPIESLHLFRAMLAESHGPARVAFHRLGIDPEAVRRAIRKILKAADHAKH